MATEVTIHTRVTFPDGATTDDVDQVGRALAFAVVGQGGAYNAQPAGFTAPQGIPEPKE